MEEADFFSQYGDCLVKFSSYYKYTFTFRGADLQISAGGDKDDIYRFTVEPNKEYKVSELPVHRAYKAEELIYEAW